jgi:hypothetical protein
MNHKRTPFSQSAGPAGVLALLALWAVTSACGLKCDEFEIGILCGAVTEDVKYLIGLDVGQEIDTDATVAGAQVGANSLIGGVGFDASISYGRGDQDFGSGEFLGEPFAKALGISKVQSEHTKYGVWQFGVRARYPFKVSDDSAIRVYPFAGPKIYRWKLRNCEGPFCDAENSFMFDIGAGAAWRFIGLDIYTTLDGPSFGARVKLLGGIGRK